MRRSAARRGKALAPTLLLLALAFAGCVDDHARGSIVFYRRDPAPDIDAYNLSEEQARSLPGDIPGALAKAAGGGGGEAKMTTSEMSQVVRALEGDRTRFVRYQGMLFEYEVRTP